MPRRCKPIYDDSGKWIGSVTVQVQAHHCKTCGKQAGLQCDYPIVQRNGARGTCDRWICDVCATEVGHDRHYCPPHERASRLPGVP